MNLSPVLTQQDKDHDRNMLPPEVLVPLCCRAARTRKVHFGTLSCPEKSCQCGSRNAEHALGGQVTQTFNS